MRSRDVLVLVLLAVSSTGGAAHSSPAQRTTRGEPPLTSTAQGIAVLDAEDARAETQQHIAVLVEGARSTSPVVKRAAIRALGRVERREAVSLILPYLLADEAEVRAEAANALAQAMRGEPLKADTAAQHVDGALVALLSAAGAEKTPANMPVVARALARLPFQTAPQVTRAEALLVSMLTLSKALSVRIGNTADAAQVIRAGAAGLELLARQQRTLYQPADATIELLRGIAGGTGTTGLNPAATRGARRLAFLALTAARGVDEETLRPNLGYGDDPDLRRLAITLLAGAASPIQGDERREFIREALDDASHAVRIEALRAYARHQAKADGCLPLLQMASDRSEHVALAAIDALGDVCADDDSLERLVAEVGFPASSRRWRRQSHALVALAKRARDRVAVPLFAHASHDVWQVRMYAARAAAAAADAPTLARLALDAHDNVRDAALPPLKRVQGDASLAAFVQALGRSDYQLLRTAAREMSGFPPSHAVAEALVEALLRVTAQKRETSRDARLALLERLQEFGDARYAGRLRPLLRDFDGKVASLAAATLTAWTGQAHVAEPQPLPRQALPSAAELATLREQVAMLALESGKEIFLVLDAAHAPLTAVRFLRLANANYYDGLTFHRVVPNFVLQGGSPGANEYMGDGPYLRDEISARTHARGTVGLSTRGRDTGDAQFFINLVDNPRLDFEYTVFGHVHADSLERIDEILEGDRIAKVEFVRASRAR